MGISVGYPVNDFGASDKPIVTSAGLGMTLQGSFSALAHVSYQRYPNVENLEGKYLVLGLGFRLAPRLPWVSRAIAYLDVAPSAVVTEWTDTHIHHGNTEQGVTFAGGLGFRSGGRYTFTIVARRYLSEGEEIKYTDIPPRDLPGMASTVISLGVDVVLGSSRR